MTERNTPIKTAEEALLWLRQSNFTTLYPSEYARIAKQCADVLEWELAALENDLRDACESLRVAKDLVTRYAYPDTTGR